MEKIKAELKRLIWLPTLGIIILIAWIFLPSLSRCLDLKQRVRELNTKIANTKLERFYLEEEKGRLENDDFYLEKVAREKLGVVKKGEILYKIVPEEIDSSQ